MRACGELIGEGSLSWGRGGGVTVCWAEWLLGVLKVEACFLRKRKRRGYAWRLLPFGIIIYFNFFRCI
jgi:hypothetical protein